MLLRQLRRSMYIDSHAHIFYEEYRDDLEDVLRRAVDAGVETVIVPGTSADTSREAVELAERHDCVYACVGIHPHEAGKTDDASLVEIESMSRHRKVVAIGEIGLDYFYDFSPRERQMEVLNVQLDIAVRRNLPAVLHTRDSMLDTMQAVKQAVARAPQWRNVKKGKGGVSGTRGVFHCFTGTAAEARSLFSLGFFVSFPGIVTFRNSPVAAVLKDISWENILLETDSPYLTPVPFRGKRNEPSNIPLIANKIAELCQTSPAIVGEQATINTRMLFSLPD